MMQQSIGVVPDGLPVSTVSLSDEYDPVAMWLNANARPFYDREAHAPAPTGPGYGYPCGHRTGPARVLRRRQAAPDAPRQLRTGSTLLGGMSAIAD